MSSKPTFFARYALIILVIVFFLVPFAMRGARMSVSRMKNDVKDWLPSNYKETAELDWFRKNFISEQFVIVTWNKCHGDNDDQRFKLFVAKLSPETPPSMLPKKQSRQAAPLENASDEPLDGAPLPLKEATGAAEPSRLILPTQYQADDAGGGPTAADLLPPTAPPAPMPGEAAPDLSPPTAPAAGEAQTPISSPTKMLAREHWIGDTYGLYTADSYHENWGGRKEKWLKGALYRTDSGGKSMVAEEKWFFITPEGDLFLWDVVDSPVAAGWRAYQRQHAKEPVEGKLIHSFGAVDGPWYYANPRRLRAQLFKSVTTGPDVLQNLVREGGVLADDHAEAQRRLTGTMFGPDGKQTCILVTLTDAARRDLHQLVGRGMLGKPRGRLYEIAEECNITADELRLGGPPVDNVAIDEEGSVTLVRLIGLCAILGIGLSYACFRSISATMMVFFVGGISAVLSLAFVYWLGSSVDAITMSMPALVYVLGLSGAAHIINYYQEAVNTHGHEGACESAVSHGWKPALFCNITTAIGLLSLYTSEIIPIRKFGIFAAIGVLATLVVSFTYLPAVLQIWPQRRRTAEESKDGEWLERLLGGFWQQLGAFCIRNHGLVAIGCVLFIAVTGYGVVYVQTSVNLLKMFHKDAKIIQDYGWLEGNLGRLVPMEVVIKVDKKLQLAPARERENQPPHPEQQVQLSFLERMEVANQVQQVVEEEFGPKGRDLVGRAMSAATFAPKLPAAKGDTATFARRGATGRLLESHRDEFLHSDYLRVDKETDSELWRVSLRLGSTQGVDYGEFVKDLKRAVEPVMSAHACREQILKGIIQQRNGGPPMNANVLLLGVPADALTKPTNKTTEGATEDAKTKLAVSVNQTKIFARSLMNLLGVSRLKVRAHDGDPNTIDPEKFDQLIASQDCVILVGNCEAYHLDGIRQTAKCFIDAREHVFDPTSLVAKTADERGDKVAAVYTGVVPIVYKAQRALLESLIESTFWSFITITPLMMFVARSIPAGAVAMLPNVLPVLVIFGGMGWLGIDVDVGSMMTASIALGVAVDDTIHYLNWFREELDRVGDRHQAILGAYRHCATPTFQSALISGLGLSIFALSTFTPTQRFGYLMLSILWAGVVAELIFFPALLAGPLGRVFKPRPRKSEDQAPSAASHTAPTVHEPVSEIPPPHIVTTVPAPHVFTTERAPAVATPPAAITPAPMTPAVTTPAATPSTSLPKPSFASLFGEAKPATWDTQPSGSVPPPNMGRNRSAVLKILSQDKGKNEGSF